MKASLTGVKWSVRARARVGVTTLHKGETDQGHTGGRDSAFLPSINTGQVNGREFGEPSASATAHRPFLATASRSGALYAYRGAEEVDESTHSPTMCRIRLTMRFRRGVHRVAGWDSIPPNPDPDADGPPGVSELKGAERQRFGAIFPSVRWPGEGSENERRRG